MFSNLSKLKDRLANAMRFSTDEPPKLPNPFTLQRTIIDPSLLGVLNSEDNERSTYSSSLTPFNFSMMKPTLNSSGLELKQISEDEQLRNLQDSINKLILDITTEELQNQY